MLRGGWGERKRERARHDGKGKERRQAPAFVPCALSIFSITAIFIYIIGIPSGSLCGGERLRAINVLDHFLNVHVTCTQTQLARNLVIRRRRLWNNMLTRMSTALNKL